MKNTSRRLIAWFLIIAMVSAILASCANNDQDNQNIVDPNIKNEGNANAPVFIEEDFDGDTLTFLVYGDNATDFIDHYIDNDEINGEPINDAVIERNRAVEEKYNVDIVQRKCTSTPGATAQREVKAGSVDFDIVYEWGIRQVPFATEGMYYDLLQVPNIDMTQSYWAPSTQDDLTIADKMLIFTNDISMNRIGWAYFLFFNKTMADDLNLDLPYDYVEQNNWTFDTFLEMVIGAEQDDGDTIWTNDDSYGYFGDSVSVLTNFATSAGITGTIKKDDGTYELDILNEKLNSIYTNYAKKMATSPSFCSLSLGEWLDGYDQASEFLSPYKAHRYRAFGEGHCLFASFSMDMTHELVNMEDDYGVVPNPKYDSAQQDYFHTIDTCAPMFAIIKQAEDLDMIGIVLEYMAYESEQRLLPAFYEQTIKTKRMSDLEGRDEKMLDIIRDSVHYSWTSLYYLALKNGKGDAWDPCGDIISGIMSSGNMASIAKSYSKLASNTIADLYDLILEMDVNK